MEEVTDHVADGVVLLVDGEYRSIGHLKSVKGEQINAEGIHYGNHHLDVLNQSMTILHLGILFSRDLLLPVIKQEGFKGGRSIHPNPLL